MGILKEKKIAVVLALIVMIGGSMLYFLLGLPEMDYDAEAFIREMIMHHQEAVDSSRIMLNSENPRIRELAGNIIDMQEKEITLLKSWLDEWYPSSKETKYMQMMPKLSSTPSKERDISYLKGMIKHHKGAIRMSENVLLNTPRTEVKILAEGIVTVQAQEILMMEGIIRTINGVLV